MYVCDFKHNLVVQPTGNSVGHINKVTLMRQKLVMR